MSSPTARRRGVAALATLSALTFAGASRAAGPPVPGLGYHSEWREENERDADPKPDPLQLLNYFFIRATVTNQLGDPAGLKGVSLGPLGALGGSGTRTGKDTSTFYVEQRWIPVISYSPAFADGLATFRAQFEVDFTWGLAANQVQQNQGGGLNVDQVNLQTKNVNAAIYPTRDPEELSIVLGAQAAYDTIYDPAITPLFDLVKTGYKLSFFGTDAVGGAVYSRLGGIWKLGVFPFGSAQPDKALKNDPRFSYAWLATADYAYPILPGTVVGASFWHLQDDTRGAAYAFEGLVGSGPSSTGLSSFTGTARFNMDQPAGNVEYIGANFHHNIGFFTGDLAATGFFMYNRGAYTSQKEDTQLNKVVDVEGVAANLELMYRWGRTNRDLITLEGMFTSGDGDPTDEKYTSALTMNFYGLPGAVWFNHKTLLLFPFTNTVSNYTGAVSDISNQGFGLGSAIATASYDIVPNRLNLKVGGAFAQAMATPPPTPEGARRGRFIGVEVNAELVYQLRYLMNIGLHGGFMKKGNFYEGNPRVTEDPWAAFTTFTWYAF